MFTKQKQNVLIRAEPSTDFKFSKYCTVMGLCVHIGSLKEKPLKLKQREPFSLIYHFEEEIVDALSKIVFNPRW